MSVSGFLHIDRIMHFTQTHGYTNAHMHTHENTYILNQHSLMLSIEKRLVRIDTKVVPSVSIMFLEL